MNVQTFSQIIKRRTLSKFFDGQVWSTSGAIFSTSEAHAPSVKEFKIPCFFWQRRKDAVNIAGIVISIRDLLRMCYINWLPYFTLLYFAKRLIMELPICYGSDIDECAVIPDICRHGYCINTDGSFRCDCPAGYRYTSTLYTCEGSDSSLVAWRCMYTLSHKLTPKYNTHIKYI